MALIGKIRKHIWIVVVLIAVALLGFIVQDMFSGQQSIFGSQDVFIGKVNGNKLENRKFSQDEALVRDFLYRGSNVDAYAIRSTIWDYFVEDAIVRDEAEALGIGVSKEELLDLQFGNNISPVIAQRFQNQQTRQLEREQLQMIKQQIQDNSLDPNFKVFWAYQEKEVIKDRLQSKLANMVSKAIFTPTWMVEMLNKEQSDQVDLAYVRIPFDEVDNSEVSLTDDDFKAYFEENKYKYRRDEETRTVKYLEFAVTPTSEDSATLKKVIADRVQPFAETTDDSLFVEGNFGTYTGQYELQESISNPIADTVFSVPVGTVIGPYMDGAEYKAVKVIDRKIMADSVDTRHILLSADNPDAFTQAEKTLDSLKNLLEARVAVFDSLASKFSKDPGSSSNGGKYENVTPGQFVPEYDKVLFETGEIGKLYKVKTSFGWHLVEVLARKGGNPRVKLAYISQAIVPGDETQRRVYNEVYQLVQQSRTLDELKKVADAKEDLELKSAPGLKRNDFIVGELGMGNASRMIVRWAFGDDERTGKPSIGEVSPEIFTYRSDDNAYDSKYVLAGLEAIVPAGVPNWKDVRTEIEPQVINKKKGEIIKGKINTQDLQAIAASFNAKVDTVKTVTFGSGFLGGLGSEPKVVATAFQMDVNAVSAPIDGSSGVVVLKVLDKRQGASATAIPALRNQFAANVKSQVTSRLVKTMVSNADVTDNRSRFY